jgi:1,4-alpha-glucan branching enzyme
MRKFLHFLFLLPVFTYAQVQTVTYTVTPAVIEENISMTITINGSSVNESTWGITNNSLYLWAWSYDLNDANSMDCPTNGTWNASSETNKFTYNSGTDTYTMTFVPQTFYARTGIGRIGFLVKAKDGAGDKKSQDIYKEVGAFSVTMINPDTNNGTIYTNSGGSQTIMASNGNGNATYQLNANGSPVTSQTTTFFNYNYTNITENKYCELVITQGTSTITKYFSIVINPGTISAALPGGMEDGINYNLSDPTKATLVLNAPLKDFVYVAGSFNNWQPTTAYAMKKDATSGKYWLELTGLTSGQLYGYQYWVFETTQLANSPKLVKTADPFSTLVLSPFDDGEIITLGVYPGLPSYASIAPGQEREVTVLQTNQPAYNWQVTNFAKPKEEDLVVYEVLIRDFDTPRTFQSLINRIDYFKNLNVNAIELMPVMEFEGNEGWGYNPSFHLALDKFYGPANKLKEFVDLCHQNGIAVILDVALNHAFGRNPMDRMWMLDADKDGWGDPSSENPYFNMVATHSYSVGNDFNHSTAVTRYYTKRVIKQWVQEFKIDGFRWDLTKGFTQNATGSDALTNQYQQDRVDVLKEYADYSWSLDPDHYVIFEHLGADNEEQQWANHRDEEGKGVMLWGEMTWAYRQLTMGWNSSANISRMSHASHGFDSKRLLGYPESHDKERLMYDNITYGNNTNGTHNVRNLNTALYRMSALGATSIMIPGPKMIWHFADLGMQNSIFTCPNGTVNDESSTIAGDCKLSTKAQPQWTEDWLNVAQRQQIYEDWSRMIDLKINEQVFEGNFSIDSNDTDLTPRIFVWNDALPSSQLKNVVILANFDVTAQNIVPDFPYTGTWYNLMDETTFSVSNTATAINVEAGGFRIFGNKPSTLSNEDNLLSTIQIYPNPAKGVFNLNLPADSVQIFDTTGKLVKQFTQVQDQTYTVSELKPALYFVRIQTTNGVSTQQLVIE